MNVMRTHLTERGCVMRRGVCVKWEEKRTDIPVAYTDSAPFSTPYTHPVSLLEQQEIKSMGSHFRTEER